MKKSILVLLAVCLLSAVNLTAKSLQAHFSFATFFAPGTGPYVETYLNVNGISANYSKVQSGNYQAAIQVSIVYSQLDKVIYFDKYNLLSPETSDTLKSLYNFTDQKRVSLPNGDYKLVITIKDKNNPDGKPYELKQDINLSYQENVIAISDIEILQDFKPSTTNGPLVKSGYQLEPLVDNFFPKENSEVKFYAEIYNTASILNNELFLLNYHIETFETKKVIPELITVSRQNSKLVSPVLSKYDLSDLPSGNYNIVIEVRNRNNDLLAVKTSFFQRSAPLPEVIGEGGDFHNLIVENTFAARISNRDSLAEYIRCLFPIASPNENVFAMNELDLADLVTMQKYFYNFWHHRNAANPEKAWIEYKIQVDKADAFYHSVGKKGYQTDRGRVFLQYGPPNHIAEQYHEPDSYPYEIWQYYKAKNESNRKFVFYDRDIATSEMKLLHSDAKGEIYERQWQYLLHNRGGPIKNIDNNTPGNSYYGNKANDLYKSPH